MLVGLSQLLIDVSQVAEVSLDPLLVGTDGALALQARVRLSVSAPAGALNFAIRPYPSQLVETLDWQGQPLTVRPIRPEDELQHTAFLSQLDPADIRMRVFYSRRSIERSELARLTQIDYAREMALVAVECGPDGLERTLGVVRAIADPDNISAEFGIVIRSDMKGRRLGPLLMQRIIDYQRGQGTEAGGHGARREHAHAGTGAKPGLSRPSDESRRALHRTVALTPSAFEPVAASFANGAPP